VTAGNTTKKIRMIRGKKIISYNSRTRALATVFPLLCAPLSSLWLSLFSFLISEN